MVMIIAAILYTRSKYRPKIPSNRKTEGGRQYPRESQTSQNAPEKKRVDKENKNEPQNYTQTEV